ncbi:polysaccharide export protein [Ramlibacter sp. USB13]|uniref:Polysaccharide export protein n=1 Tax=Ramlibacter cellulosilyticus TaxID=2764187 RepID=A0A923MNK0_9BURK|nr:polysaccharide biosynthesis/export family protein [Ramlibacter cellulosilyticus]MBC5781709.1 polysaccharide export protein [Ramlibacter cellulosilyticus]
MSSIIHKYALATAWLFISTVSAAQTSTGVQLQGGSPGSPADGMFRPAGSQPQQIRQEPEQQAKPAMEPSQPSAVYTIGREYRIGPNDLLEIEILNLENAKRTVRVNAAGAITLPLIGAVIVAGLTQQEVEGHLANLYGDKYLQDPQVSVFIKEFTTERITVDGAVAKPGIYPLVGQMTLLRVLALAGGFAQIARRDQVMLFRQGDGGERQVATFDIEKIRAGQQPDPPIRGDDLIVVQRDSTRAAITDSVFRDVLNVVNPFYWIGR